MSELIELKAGDPRWFALYYMRKYYEDIRDEVEADIDNAVSLCMDRWWRCCDVFDRPENYGSLVVSYCEALEDEYRYLLDHYKEMPGILSKQEQTELLKIQTKIKALYKNKDELIFEAGGWSDHKVFPAFSDDPVHVYNLSVRVPDMVVALPQLYNDFDSLFVKRCQVAENNERVKQWVKKQNESPGAAFVLHFLGMIDKFKESIKIA